MQIDVSTPALLFPAISLLLLAYTNRFLGIAQLIRQLRKRMEEGGESRLQRQVDSLRLRVRYIIWMQAVGVLSLILCTVSMLSHFIDAASLGLYSFGLSLILMILSLLFSLYEIAISGNALNVELEGMEQNQ